MSTLSPYGMFGFKVKRPLSNQELIHHFSIHEPASEHPHYDLSLTLLNSTFAECVDKWYAMRGLVLMIASIFGLLSMYGLYTAILISNYESAPGWLMLLALLPIGMIGWLAYVVTLDAFTYTHYPIRFNRKNQQVYAFRRNGSVLKVAWKDIYWTIHGAGVGVQSIFVAGHVMSPDGQTVHETFALAGDTVGKAGEQELRDLFEFFRLYMEKGPEQVLKALHPTPLIMLPGIHKQKESWRFGWERITLHENGSLIGLVLYQVVAIPMSLFRWIAMRTSKIPQWPQWVEDECHVEPDDPWIRDERHAAR